MPDVVITNALFTCLEITLIYTSIYLPNSLLVAGDLNCILLVHRCTTICRTEKDSSLNCGHVTDPFEWKFAGTEKVAEPLECYVIVQ